MQKQKQIRWRTCLHDIIAKFNKLVVVATNVLTVPLAVFFFHRHILFFSDTCILFLSNEILSLDRLDTLVLYFTTTNEGMWRHNLIIYIGFAV